MSDSQPLTQRLRAAYSVYAQQQTFEHEPKTLYSPIRYAMEARGKGIRPQLLLLAHALGGADVAHALPAAYALELFHNFTLVHDDIMDEADTRRGRPAVHKAYNSATAILSGDAMLIRTYGYLLECYSAPLSSQLLSTFQAMAVALCEGQQRDMDMETGEDVSYSHYLKMIHGKTGVLITASLVMGGQIAELGQSAIEQLGRIGDLAGRAFQIQDDLLDTFRTSAATGKPSYGDVVRGKQSAPYLKALQLSDDHTREQLQEAYQWSTAERKGRVQEVLDIYRSLGVEKSLATEVEEYTQKAISLLDQLPAMEEARKALRQVILQLAQRAS